MPPTISRHRLILSLSAFALLGCLALSLFTTRIPYSSGKDSSSQAHSCADEARLKAVNAADRSIFEREKATVRNSPITRENAADVYGRLPLSFEVNRGQSDKRVKFFARGQGYGLFLTSTAAVLSLNKTSNEQIAQDSKSDANNSNKLTIPERAVLSMNLLEANPSSRIAGDDKLPGKVNYFLENDPSKWRTNVQTYSKVRYRGVYRGVDMVYYGNQRQLEYDFEVAPGADPKRISLGFAGADCISVDQNGDMILSTSAGEVVQRKPVAYQDIDGKRREVSATYRVEGTTVSFDLGAYDQTRPLTIDPVLVYSTFFGGTSQDSAAGVAVNAQGNVFLSGSTISSDFPVVGGAQTTSGGFDDAIVVKLNPAGTAALYSTYLGGGVTDFATAIAIDAQGNAYVAGGTDSPNFPITPGSFQVTKGFGMDGFVTKLNPTGSALAYSTFLGGDNAEIPRGIAVSTDSRTYVVGSTDSTNFNAIPLQRQGSPVYKSIDSGANWTASSAGITGSSVVVFAQHPANSNIVYAGTNIGVFKSTDAGANWSITGTDDPATAPKTTTSVVVDPSNPNIVYAGTSEGVFKSTNGGALYAPKNDGLPIPIVTALAIDPITPTTLYAGSIFGVSKSTNGGDTWVDINFGFTGGRVTALAIDPINPAILYLGTTRGLFKTTNGGSQWTIVVNGPIFQSVGILALAINPLNPLVVYAGATFSGGMYKTTDGATWSVSNTGLESGPINSLAIDGSTPAKVYAAISGRGIYKSTDSGANWTLSNAGLGNTGVSALLVDRNTPATVYAGTTIGGDAFAVKFDSSGSALDYLLTFGGNELDEAAGVAVGSNNLPFIVGSTSSQNFPVTNAIQSISGGTRDAFVAKLNAAGSGFLYSTYLGGSAAELGRAIAVRDDKAYVVGATASADYPVVNAFQAAIASVSNDAFFSTINSAGSALEFSSYLGGTGADQALAVALDSNGNIYVTGSTNSVNFPTLNPTQAAIGSNFANDVFVTKLNPSGTSLLFSTFLGGTSSDQGNGIAIDPAGNTYVTGSTSSSNFPTVNPIQPFRGTDAFVTKFGAVADLAITKTDSRDPVMVGNNLTYTLTVTNIGPDAASDTVLSDTLPAGVNFVSITPSQGNCSGTGTVTCNLGSLAKDASATVTVVITPPSVSTITNTATVTNGVADLNLANNSATQETRVSALPSIAGHIASSLGTPTASVNVALAGAQSANTTNASGFYQFPDLTVGGNYTVIPSLPGFVFHPQSQTVNNLTSDFTADFQSVACLFQIAPTNQSFPASGGNGAVIVTAPDSLCPWTATSDVPWITVTSGPINAGSGTITFSVAPTTRSRSGTLRIANNVFTVWQEVSPCSTVSFLDAPTFPAGNLPLAVAGGDFNNDGKPDVAFMNGVRAFQNGKVSVVLGDGFGGFSSPISIDLPWDPTDMSVADFNGDGKLDVAVSVRAVTTDVRLHILLGDGTGHLTLFATASLDAFPTSLTIGEFNQDGKPDIAIARENSHDVSILLGTGTGAVGPPTQVGGPTSTFGAQRVVVGDFNSDNKQDLIVERGSLTLFLGNGDGSFMMPTQFFNLSLKNVVVADFNKDGKDDLAGATANDLTVVLGDGTGGFGSPIQSSNGGRIPGPLVVADFNSDANPDLGSANNAFTSTFDVNVFLGNGAGSFTAATAYRTGFAARDLVAADFNGDGKQDIVAAISHSLMESAAGEFAFLAGTGSGNFVGAKSFVAPSTIQNVVPLNFGPDNKLDLLVITTQGVSLLPGTTLGEFGSPISLLNVQPTAYSTREVNHDGKPDLILRITDFSGNFIRVYVNNGAGGLSQVSETTLSNNQNPIVVDDFNTDGHPDLIALDTAVGLTLRLGDGSGGFNSPSVISALTNVWDLTSGDFNGDSKRDLAINANFSSCGPPSTSQLQILLGNGVGGFSTPPSIITNGNIANLLTHDLNGDGRSDLIAINTCSGKLVVFLANNAGGLVSGVEFSGGPGAATRIALGDMNGDGKPDLIVSNTNNQVSPSTVSVLLGNGEGGFSGLSSHIKSIYTMPVAVGDYDNDGRDDLAFSDLHGNHIGVFLNSCAVTFPLGVKLTAAQFAAGESDARVVINVSRSGDASAAATVDYKTSDTADLTNCNVINGVASSRCDYATSVGVLRFAAGETSKTISIPIVDDAYAEGSESFTITLSNATGVALSSPASATVTINDNDTSNGTNPIDQTAFFVRQQYVDFLGREPDPQGFADWQAVINNCPPNDTTCDRIHVSSNFFRSPEFQDRGYFVFRFYPVTFGRKPGFVEFIPDLAKVSGFLTAAELEAAKVAFIAEFMNRPAFVTKFGALNNTQYVDTLLGTAQITHPNRDAWIDALGAGTKTRAVVLREIAESTEVFNKYFNQAFVVMQYFGYLRREPDAFYLDWIAHLDSTNDFRSMINGFMNSLEYRARFGP